MTSNQINDFFNLRDEWNWVSFIIVPFYIFLKTIIITSVIYAGTFIIVKSDVTFNKILNVTLQAELIFLLVPIFKALWFYFFHSKCTLEDIQYFMPLSALNIVGYHGLDAWLIYPLQVLNLFELAYIIYLSNQIGQLTGTNTDTGLQIVGYSYVPALLLWVTVVMFFTLNYT
jgi:hypothetical protein